MDLPNNIPKSPFTKTAAETNNAGDSSKGVELIKNELVIAPARNGIINARIHLGKGKYKYVSLKTRSMNEAPDLAKAAYYKVKTRVELGVEVKRITFAQVWAEFVKHCEREQAVGHRTHWSIRMLNYSGGYLVPFFGNKTLDQINQALVADFLIERSKAALAARDGKPLAAKTLNTHVNHLKMCLAWAAEHKKLSIVTLDSIKKVEGKENPRSAFTKEQWETLAKLLASNAKKHKNYKAIYRQRLRHVVLLLAQTGMRPGELLNLRWKDVSEVKDSENNLGVMFSVRISKVAKFVSIRHVIARQRAREYLARWKKLASRTGPDDLIFGNDEGEYWDKSEARFRKFMKANADKIGVDLKHGYSLYSLRHTYATFYLQGKHPDVFWLASHLGTSVDMIRKHYSHVMPMDKVDVAMGRVR